MNYSFLLRYSMNYCEYKNILKTSEWQKSSEDCSYKKHIFYDFMVCKWIKWNQMDQCTIWIKLLKKSFFLLYLMNECILMNKSTQPIFILILTVRIFLYIFFFYSRSFVWLMLDVFWRRFFSYKTFNLILFCDFIDFIMWNILIFFFFISVFFFFLMLF